MDNTISATNAQPVIQQVNAKATAPPPPPPKAQAAPPPPQAAPPPPAPNPPNTGQGVDTLA